MSTAVFVILGAAVWPGGVPSNAMRRRVAGALDSARGYPGARFLVTGGLGRNPPSEAKVMQQLLLEAGIVEEQILLDEDSTDTLESVINCGRILRKLPDVGQIFICTDGYHALRTRWLFYLRGMRTRAGCVPSGRRQMGLGRWLYYCLREVPAMVQDTVLLLASR